MDFSDPPRRRAQENLLPMINVVFLLLIFFLISARMTPPEPFAVTPPEAHAQAEAQGDFALFISADGLLGYGDTTGDPALVALAAAHTGHCIANDCTAAPPRLTLRADAALPAARLAQILPQLTSLGFAQIELVALTGAAP
ncbi:biopolymer transporter ExbD [Pseudotabrizicola sp.]|uniref:ExbD/TolR family protein n=1 Tax=Pseudotabrizicola sp. TaxID=2939647 RepID=UPI0027223788|nr:biopolymer transporter ExbD [Pseudotabrizicola sp.]MDO8884536.1 biopolymer transporter ExbD [Pseudotabrizicola sp.]